MSKRKTVRFQFTAPALFDVYVDRLLARGTFGDTRTEVVRRLVANSLMEALSGDEIRRLSEDYHAREAINQASEPSHCEQTE